MFKWLAALWQGQAPAERRWEPSGIKQREEFSRYDPQLQARAQARRQREVDALRRKAAKRLRPKPVVKAKAKALPPVSLRAVAGERRG